MSRTIYHTGILLLLLLFLCTSCSPPHQPQETLIPYDPITTPFIQCAAVPWQSTLKRALQEIKTIDPTAELLRITSSPTADIGYTSELVIHFEFRILTRPIPPSTSNEPSPIVTIHVPECHQDAATVTNTGGAGYNDPVLDINAASLIPTSPRQVVQTTRAVAEQWLGHPIEPRDVAIITLDQQGASFPEWGIMYHGSTMKEALVFLIDTQTGQILRQIERK